MIFERIAPEQHDTLDGVPEPSETPRLVGHRQAAEMLAAAYRSGKLPHALIFAGPVGIGKATLAFHLAHHLLKHPAFAQAPESLAVPDPASPLSRQIATGAHPGVLHLTRPMNDKTKSFKTVVTVDEIRRVNRFLSMTSHDGSYRVVIVDPADDMNANAANALLKVLEEPPERTRAAADQPCAGQPAADDPLALPADWASRRWTPTMLLAVLQTAEPPPPDDPAARAALVERAGGSARNAILLTQYGGLEIAQTLDGLVAKGRSDIGEGCRRGSRRRPRPGDPVRYLQPPGARLVVGRREPGGVVGRSRAGQNPVGHLA